jgi:hypothetical protein
VRGTAKGRKSPLELRKPRPACNPTTTHGIGGGGGLLLAEIRSAEGYQWLGHH